MEKFNPVGTGVAIVTPFSKDNILDFTALRRIIEYQIQNNVNYIVVLGTTGEASTLNEWEKTSIVNLTIKIVNNRIPIVVGMGGNATDKVVNSILNINIDWSKISAILSVCPYYNLAQQQGIYSHFANIAKYSPVPVILYNVPGRTQVNMGTKITLELANNFPEKIIAIKEASGNLLQIEEIIKNKPDTFEVISGDDILTPKIIKAGGCGVISVTANAFPKEFSEMVASLLLGEYEKADKIYNSLIPIMKLLFADGNPSGIKAALNIIGLCENMVRLSLVPVKTEVFEELKKEITAYQL